MVTVTGKMEEIIHQQETLQNTLFWRDQLLLGVNLEGMYSTSPDWGHFTLTVFNLSPPEL